MKKVQTIDAKHIFIDIVNYTYNRSVEAQSEIISILNKIVKESILEKEISKENLIYIPTGDGMCISIYNINTPYDIHIQIALLILEKLYSHNENEPNKMKKFNLRIGINENTDNLIKDINNRKNISGAGINFAARIESLCDQNQILVGTTVFDKLVQREKYMNSFITYSAEIKHGLSLSVHQYKNDKLKYLNNDTPTKFRSKPKKIFRLSSLQGYYIAHCIANEDFISSNVGHGQNLYSLHVLIQQLAEDSIEKIIATKINPAMPKVNRSLQEHFNYIQSVDFGLICELKRYIVNENLSYMWDYFSEPYLFVNELGKKKLLEDQPSIAKEFKII